MKKIKPEALTFILIWIIGGSLLFLRPVIGMADNGDFYRIISQNNVYHLSIEESDRILGYFNKDFGIYKYENEGSRTLISTQSVFIKVAVFIDELFNKNYILDIRFLAVILLTLHSIAGYILVKFFSSYLKKDINKYLVSILYLFIFCDTAYIAYFNSFYGEGIIIPTFLLSVGVLLYMFKFNKINIFYLLIFGVSSFLFLGAKQQLAPIGILIALLFIRIMIIDKHIIIRYLSGVLALIFILSSLVFYKSIKGDFDYMNRFHAMNRGVLLYEDNPEKILEEFGIDPNYSLLEGEIFYEKIPSINPNDERLKENFYANYSVPGILAYYIRHPRSFMKVIKMGVSNAYIIRPKVMGNYEKKEGKAFGEKCYYFSTWSIFKENIIPRQITFTVIFVIIYFIGSYMRYKRSYRMKDINGVLIEEGFIYIFLAGLSQIIISVIGAGDADLAKHVFLYNLTFDLMVINLLVHYLVRREKNLN